MKRAYENIIDQVGRGVNCEFSVFEVFEIFADLSRLF